MNKIFKFCLICLIGTTILTSCKDMLESKSDRQIFDPALNEKTDSIFYTFGILKSMQEAADQYVLFNVMRGDLVTTNMYSETALRELANFSAGPSNKFDSAYVYYRIINNCNYYIAHRDTTLRTASRSVAIPEYAEAKAIRAWAYLQLVRTYGEVPFFEEPITTIGQVSTITATINRDNICSQLVEGLKPFSGTVVPSYGTIPAGNVNSGGTKQIPSNRCMIPIDLIIGDLYLENHQYQEAANSYFKYLNAQKINQQAYSVGSLPRSLQATLPNDFERSLNGSEWTSIFGTNSASNVITIIPMAVNSLGGTVSSLPAYFGYDYYSTSEELQNSSEARVGRYLLERQIDPSPTYYALSSAQKYYYTPSGAANNIIKESTLGDVRRYGCLQDGTINDSSYNFIDKLNNANIPLYRANTIYLRIAECVNRLGYYDIAFAILKDGISEELLSDSTYISENSKNYLRGLNGGVPFLSDENRSTFATGSGIHTIGTGKCDGTFSPYQLDTIVGLKFAELRETYQLAIDSLTATKEDTINAMEDLICDELALESAFEGTRFSDLCRIARHKNNDTRYGSNFGCKWIAKKLSYKNPVVDLTDEQNWYMKMY